jgi:hypothetical protein
MLRNSTRQPIDDFGGGGLKRKVCQFVDWMFCKLDQIVTNTTIDYTQTNLEVIAT